MGYYKLINSQVNISGGAGGTVQALVADFSFLVNGLTVDFTDSSTGTVTGWLWEFGDGTTSTSQNPSKAFPDYGIYEVRLTITGTLGTSEVIKTVALIAAAPSPVSPPNAKFSAVPLKGPAPLNVVFTDQSTGSPDSWTWDFGGDGTSTLQNPTHQFNNPGQYLVKLTVKNTATGWESSATQTIVVGDGATPEIPVAVITAIPKEGFVPLAVAFSASVTGQVDSYLWNFDDGSTSGEAAPIHVFNSAGTYEVTLTVRNIYGETTSSVTIIVMDIIYGGEEPYIYLVDRDGHRILMYSMAGVYVGSFGGYGNTLGKFNRPTTLTVIRS